MPLVSIIIPAYRAEKFIDRAVKSLFAQSITEWEAIIIADDNFDYQKLLITNGIADKRIKFTSTGTYGSGPANARNIGLAMAKSNIIATLDADDSFNKRKLETMLPLANKYGLVVSNIKIIENDTNTEITNLQYQPKNRLIKYNEILAATAYAHSVIVYKKPKKELYWPININHCEDLAFMSQIFDHYGQAFYCRAKLYNYFLHKNSLCRTKNSDYNFLRDRTQLIDMLKQGKIELQDYSIKEMLMAYLMAGIEIDKNLKKQDFSYGNYIAGLREYCPFLPDKNKWKQTANSRP